jgi:Ca2+-binding RTX toxin-like protein
MGAVRPEDGIRSRWTITRAAQFAVCALAAVGLAVLVGADLRRPDSAPERAGAGPSRNARRHVLPPAHIVRGRLKASPSARVDDVIPDRPFPRPSARDVGVHPRFGVVASPTRILVGFKERATVAQANAALARARTRILGALPRPGILLVETKGRPGFARLGNATTALRADPAIEFAAMSLGVELQALPRRPEDDAEADPQWIWDKESGRGNWGLKQARFPPAWNLLDAVRAKNPNVVTAIVDGGFTGFDSSDSKHEDLPGLEVKTKLCSNCPTLKNGNERGRRHGNHVAGTIGAAFDNALLGSNQQPPRSRGISGGNPVAKMWGVPYGNPTPIRTAVGGAAFLADQLMPVFETLLKERPPELRVINFSATASVFEGNEQGRLVLDSAGKEIWWKNFPKPTCGPGPTDDTLPEIVKGTKRWCTPNNQDDWLREFSQVGLAAGKVAKDAAEEGVIIVQAAGNDGHLFKEPGGGNVLPISSENTAEFAWASAHWNRELGAELLGLPNPVLIAQATISNDKKSGVSNLGGEIAAPGVGIASTVSNHGYEQMSGTSMAAPHVTALVSYLLARQPNLTIEQIRKRVLAWGRPAPPTKTTEPLFDWSMPDRFGRDIYPAGPDGLVDYLNIDPPDARIEPSDWRVFFDACGATTEDEPRARYTWAVNGSQVGVTSECRFHHDFPDEGTYSVKLTVTQPGGITAQQTRQVKVEDFLIASLGDSIASGEGNPDIPKPSLTLPAEWQDSIAGKSRCHRSAKSGRALAARWLEMADTHSSVTFVDLTCSGARIQGDIDESDGKPVAGEHGKGGLLSAYEGIEPPNSKCTDEPSRRTNFQFCIPPQLAQLKGLLQNRKIDAILLSIGANDMGFSELVTACLKTPRCDAPSGAGSKIFDQRIKLLPGRYATLKAALAQQFPSVPADRVMISQYHDVTRNQAGNVDLACVGLGSLPAPIPEWAPLRIDHFEANWAANTVVPKLNEAVRNAATNNGWTLADDNPLLDVPTLFRHHGYCSTDSWVVDIAGSFANQGGKDGAFHANFAGQTAYARGFIDKLRAKLQVTVDPWLPLRDTAPRLDAFASVLAGTGAAKELVDVSDPTKDGNRRIAYTRQTDGSLLETPDHIFSGVAGAFTAPDGYVDMRDFRRFRDAWLQLCAEPGRQLGACPAAAEIKLDGAVDHPKKDLNLDRCVFIIGPPPNRDPRGCRAEESWFSRFDFNGDGSVTTGLARLLPLRANGDPAEDGSEAVKMSDLDVLKSKWSLNPLAAEGWGDGDLSKLLKSADLEVHVEPFFDLGATSVDLTVRGLGFAAGVPLRTVSGADRSAVITIPLRGSGDEFEVAANATISGQTVERVSKRLHLRYGEDRRVDFCIGPPECLWVGDTAVEEASSGTAGATFLVSLTDPASTAVTVQYATRDGTAKAADGDYVPAAGTLTFAAGEQLKSLTVGVRADEKLEGTETFFLDLANQTSARMLDKTGVALIQDEDGKVIASMTQGLAPFADRLGKLTVNKFHELYSFDDTAGSGGNGVSSPTVFLASLSAAAEDLEARLLDYDGGNSPEAFEDFLNDPDGNGNPASDGAFGAPIVSDPPTSDDGVATGGPAVPGELRYPLALDVQGKVGREATSGIYDVELSVVLKGELPSGFELQKGALRIATAAEPQPIELTTKLAFRFDPSQSNSKRRLYLSKAGDPSLTIKVVQQHELLATSPLRATYGLLSGAVHGPGGGGKGIDVSGALKLALEDPDGDGRITQEEWEAVGSLTDLVSVSCVPAGSYAKLDLTLATGLTGLVGDLARLSLTDNNLCDGLAAPTLQLLKPSLVDFATLKPTDLVALLRALTDGLRSIESHGDVELPFLKEPLSHAVDLGDQLLAFLVANGFTDEALNQQPLGADDEAKLATFEKLADLLAQELGMPGGLNLRYDPVARRILFDVKLRPRAPPAHAEEFDLSLLQRAGLVDASAYGMASVQVDYAVDLTFGIDLAPDPPNVPTDKLKTIPERILLQTSSDSISADAAVEAVLDFTGALGPLEVSGVATQNSSEEVSLLARRNQTQPMLLLDLVGGTGGFATLKDLFSGDETKFKVVPSLNAQVPEFAIDVEATIGEDPPLVLGNGKVTVKWPDVTKASGADGPSVTGDADFNRELLTFDFDHSDPRKTLALVLTALRDGMDQLNRLARDNEDLSRSLPLLGAGYDDMVGTFVSVRDVADHLIKLNQNLTLQGLETALEDALANALGIPPDDMRELLTLELDTSQPRTALIVRLRFCQASVQDAQCRATAQVLKRQLSLDSPDRAIAGVDATAEVQLDYLAKGELAFGVDLPKVDIGDSVSPLPKPAQGQGPPSVFVLGSTGVSLEVQGSLEGVAKATLGPFTVSLGQASDEAVAKVAAKFAVASGGPATERLTPAAWAQKTLNHLANDPFSIRPGTQLSCGSPSGSWDGCARLPVYIQETNGDWTQLGVITFTSNDLLAGGTFTGHQAVASALAGRAFKLTTWIQGLRWVIARVKESLNGATIDGRLPLIGTDFTAGAETIAKLDAFLSKVEGLVAEAESQAQASAVKAKIQSFLIQHLGPSGLKILRDVNAPSGVGTEDVAVAIMCGAAACTGSESPVFFTDVKVQISLGQDYGQQAATPETPFELGFPGLKLVASEQVNARASWRLDLGFGADGNGFYLDTGGQELTAGVKLDVPDSMSGELAFLPVELTDRNGSADELGIELGFDIKAGHPTSKKLYLTDLAAQGLNLNDRNAVAFTIKGCANLDLGMKVSIPGGGMPALAANLKIDALWGGCLGSTAAARDLRDGLAPFATIKLTDVRLDLGTTLSGFMAPAVRQLQRFTQPAQPVIDEIRRPIPVISDLARLTGKPSFSWFDAWAASQELQGNDITFIKTLVNLTDFINKFPTTGSGEIPITSQVLVDPTLAAKAPGTPEEAFKLLKSQPVVADVMDSIKQKTGFDLRLETKKVEGGSAGKAKFTFPAFEQPTQLIYLLFGQNVDLLAFDAGPLKADEDFNVSYGLPFAKVGVAGSAKVTGHLQLSYDTEGIRRIFQQKPVQLSSLGALIHGLYLRDWNDAGEDVPELRLDADLHVYANVGVPLVSAEGQGGVEGYAELNLYDADGDGKIRYEDVKNRISRPLCLFNSGGKVQVYARVVVKGGPFEGVKDIVKPYVLLEIPDVQADCNTPPPAVTPEPATLDTNGTLHLNMGDLAKDRNYDPLQIHERFELADLGAGKVGVTGLTQYKEYGPVTKVVADGKSGNDQISVGADLPYPVDFTGGDGSDRLDGGKLDDILRGGNGPDILGGAAGKDVLEGGADDDSLRGDAGDDTLDPGTGADDVAGGEATDTVEYDDRSAALELDLDDAADDGEMGETDNVHSDVENVVAGSGADLLVGSGAANRLEGRGGNDRLRGGPGNDALVGGDQVDTVEYLDRTQAVTASLTSGGGGVSGETDGYAAVENVTGGAGNDNLSGSTAGANVLDGAAGDDTLGGETDRGTGSDQLIGGTGLDTADYSARSSFPVALYLDGTASSGASCYTHPPLSGCEQDTIAKDVENAKAGPKDDKIVAYEKGPHVLQGGFGWDELLAPQGVDSEDVLIGGDGRDDLHGFGGDDRLSGGRDADKLFGGNGDDVLLPGNDSDQGAGGVDVIDGGAGFNTADYSDNTIDVDVRLGLGCGAGTAPVQIPPTGLAGSLGSGGGLPGNSYSYWVTALNGPFQQTVASSEFVISVPPGSSVDLSWDPYPLATSYRIYRKSAGPTVYYTTESADTSFTDYGDPATAGSAPDAEAFIGITGVRGGSGADTLCGDAGPNVLDGGPGNDTLLRGGKGDDEILGGGGNDVLAGGDGDDRLEGGAADDALDGGNDDDVLKGGPGADDLGGIGGDDVLDGGPDADTIVGWGGEDTVTYAGRRTGVTIKPDGVANDGAAGESDDIANDIEVLIGGAGADTILAGALFNTIDGGPGADTIDGGAGVDDVDYSGRTGAVAVYLGGGQKSGGAADGAGDTLVDVENARGGSAADTIVGNVVGNALLGGAGDDDLLGGEGDDSLKPGTGGDRVDGGAGQDNLDYTGETQSIRISLDGVKNDGVAGEDRIDSVEQIFGGSGDDVLIGDDERNLFHGRAGNDVLFGNGGRDELTGDLGDDTFNGGPGNDQIEGGFGEDWADYFDRETPVRVNLRQAGLYGGPEDAPGDTYDKVENARGGEGRDLLIAIFAAEGNGGEDRLRGYGTLDGGPGDDQLVDDAGGSSRLRGGAGDDHLYPGFGLDEVDGGPGDDWVDYSGFAGVQPALPGHTKDMSVDLAGGTVTEQFENDSVIAVENAVSGSGNDSLSGTPGANELRSGAGADKLDGGDGDDVLDGGTGADRLGGGKGLDTLTYADRAASLSVTLDASANDGESGEGDNASLDLEHVIGGAAADSLAGSDLAVTLEGRGGGDTLTGGVGNDLLVPGFLGGHDLGTDGADTIAGGKGIDTVSYADRGVSLTGAGIDVTFDDVANDGEGAENDDVRSSVENAIGGAGPDILAGSAENNELRGGVGSDTLTGGDGNDLLDGGKGLDTFDGGSGVDHINSRDDVGEQVSCDTGKDTVLADELDQVDTSCAGDVPQPELSVSDVRLEEGDTGTADAILTLSLSAAAGQDVSVQYSTADGTAVAADDYTAVAGSVTFASGEVEKTVAVPVEGDGVDEEDEAFTLAVQAKGVELLDAEGAVTIADDDREPTISVADVTVAEDAGPAAFTVALSNASARPITVQYATQPGSALDVTDFGGIAGTLTFAPGQTAKTVGVDLVADGIDEPDELFYLDLRNAANGRVVDAQARATILDADAQPQLSVTDGAAAEWEGAAVLTVRLSAASAFDVRVDYATADGTAGQPGDYQAEAGTLDFAPGETAQDIAVPIVDDSVSEPDETVALTLSSAVSATVADGLGQLTILDDEPLPELSIAGAIVAESLGSAAFGVTLSSPSGGQVTVAYRTVDGSAASPDDFTATNGTLTFAAGDVAEVITVPIAGDSSVEVDESFRVELVSASGAQIGADGATGTIVDDDVPKISVEDVIVVEGNRGTSDATFTLRLSDPFAEAVGVRYGTADDSAGVDDYLTAQGKLEFLSGETEKIVTVAVSGDTDVEKDETFELRLEEAVNAALPTRNPTGTIVDDD